MTDDLIQRLRESAEQHLNEVETRIEAATQIEALRMAVRWCIDTIERANNSTGYCCCGSSMESHGMGDGHSPVDQGDYGALITLESARAALAGEKS